MEVVGDVEGLIAGLFLGGNGGIEFAGGDFICSGVDKAELAGGKIVFLGAHRWAEGAAEDRSMFVEIAGAVVRVEDRAGLVVGELLEENLRFVVFVE